MRQVWKYKIHTNGTIYFPCIPKFLKFDIQHGDFTAWFEVIPSEEKIARNFAIYGTGQDIPDNMEYLGTCFNEGFVWHLYQEK